MTEERKNAIHHCIHYLLVMCCSGWLGCLNVLFGGRENGSAVEKSIRTNVRVSATATAYAESMVLWEDCTGQIMPGNCYEALRILKIRVSSAGVNTNVIIIIAMDNIWLKLELPPSDKLSFLSVQINACISFITLYNPL